VSSRHEPNPIYQNVRSRGVRVESDNGGSVDTIKCGLEEATNDLRSGFEGKVFRWGNVSTNSDDAIRVIESYESALRKGHGGTSLT